jgi:hypothetical protein
MAGEETMLTTLRVLLILLGIAAIAIAGSILIAGPAETAWMSERLYAALTGSRASLTPPWPATMDSELRFYAPFWGSYGAILLAVARRLPVRLGLVPWLAALFLAGGIGRAVSYAAIGAPHPVFVVLMAIELVLPVIFAGLWLGVRLTRKAPSV